MQPNELGKLWPNLHAVYVGKDIANDGVDFLSPPDSVQALSQFWSLLGLRKSSEERDRLLRLGAGSTHGRRANLLFRLDRQSAGHLRREYESLTRSAETIACHIKQQFPNLTIILLSA